MSTTLPPEIVSDVLCRLPVKSLLRFRCISKPVCSMIDGPDFIKQHLNRSSQTNHNQSLILRNWNCPLFSIDLRSVERAVEIEHPIKALEEGFQLLGSCNGLLCFCNSNSESEIVIWNMSTRKHHQLPHSHTIFPNQDDVYSHQVAYGFGYDCVHDDYKLLRVVRFQNTSDTEVMVYSLKSNSWKKKLCGFPYDLYHMRSVGLFTNSALHWLIDHPSIVAFDLATEEFREVSLPPDDLREVSIEQLGVFEGRLCVIRISIGRGVEIWVLKNNEGPGESFWEKLLSILDPSSHSIVPIAYVRGGNELLLLQDGEKFLCYDLKTNKVKNVRVHGLPNSFDTMLYFESLVKPFPMINATLGKDKGRRAKKNNAAKRDDFLSKGFKLIL